MQSTRERKEYNQVVSHPFHVFNGIFLTLPLDGIRQTGLRVPLLQEACEAGLAKEQTPTEILEGFFRSQGLADTSDQTELLFRIIQYVERQVVLVDALEDARYAQLNDMGGTESLMSLMQRVRRHGLEDEFRERLATYAVRVVLTAHPTQFYPGNALAIITDLAQAMEANDLVGIRKLLHQLGLTPFFQSEPPTPFDEAVRQTWYLENVFFHAAPELFSRFAQALDDPAGESLPDGLVGIGFWPGGDRDGNPFVTAETTVEVADRLRMTLLRAYRREVRALRRRITFRHASPMLDAIQNRIEQAMQVDAASAAEGRLTAAELRESLMDVVELVESDYNGLYAEQVHSLVFKVRLFGMHFASIDIRQDSRVVQAALDAALDILHPGGHAAFRQLPEADQTAQLFTYPPCVGAPNWKDRLREERHRDIVESLVGMRDIQARNGELGCHRYILSNCRGTHDLAALWALARMSGWSGEMSLDLVPLFETIDDLASARAQMESLYAIPAYRAHLEARHNRQTVMLGFSDGTKDGGYLRANLSIYEAKRSLTAASRGAGITVLFFDGRGGPPARGGGNTHRFYASLGQDIENTEIQTTIQGQTISSNFGIPRSAGFNLELLLTAGLRNRLFDDPGTRLEGKEQVLLDWLANESYQKYSALKAHPAFLDYLATFGTLKYYGETNIASRPTSRKPDGPLNFSDLRAIPFVGSWSQLKQNVPGYYGLGTALEALDAQGRLSEAADLYAGNAFFRALVENSMQSMMKCDFRLTAHLKRDERFGGIWQDIYEEFERTKSFVLRISGQTELMQSHPHIRESIALRDGLIKPLLIIQHFALSEIDRMASAQNSTWDREILKRLVIRSMYGIVNASRNAV